MYCHACWARIKHKSCWTVGCEKNPRSSTYCKMCQDRVKNRNCQVVGCGNKSCFLGGGGRSLTIPNLKIRINFLGGGRVEEHQPEERGQLCAMTQALTVVTGPRHLSIASRGLGMLQNASLFFFLKKKKNFQSLRVLELQLSWPDVRRLRVQMSETPYTDVQTLWPEVWRLCWQMSGTLSDIWSFGDPKVLRRYGDIVFIVLSISMGAVSHRSYHHQAIQSILCCASNHYSYTCDFNRGQAFF